MEIIDTSIIQQERLQAIAEKRKHQAEIENKRRQLEDDRRQLQHLKSKTLRERWLLEGAPSSTAEEGDTLKKQMQDDDLKAKELEDSIQRLEKELEQLENGISASSTKENMAEETRAAGKAPSQPYLAQRQQPRFPPIKNTSRVVSETWAAAASVPGQPGHSRDARTEVEENLWKLVRSVISASSTKENMAEETRAAGKEDKSPRTPKTPLGSAKVENRASNSPIKVAEGGGMMKAAMYSVEITVEKDKLTGETKVLSSTTRLPKDRSVQGVKVYEDEMKVVHAVRVEDGALENGLQQLSSSEVDELIHKADEVTLSEASEAAKGPRSSNPPSQKATPRKEITGVQSKPVESPKLMPAGQGPEPSKEQPVTMIFMGYQNVEDEDETKKVLGLEGTIRAELVVIEDAENKAAAADCRGKEHAPPNGSAVAATAAPQKEENQAGEPPTPNSTDPKEAEQEIDAKKQRCKCCSVM